MIRSVSLFVLAWDSLCCAVFAEVMASGGLGVLCVWDDGLGGVLVRQLSLPCEVFCGIRLGTLLLLVFACGEMMPDLS